MEKIRSKILTSFLVVIAVLMISAGFFVSLNFMIIMRYERIMTNMVSEYELIAKTQDLTESFNNLIKYSSDYKRFNTFVNYKNELLDLLTSLDSSIEGEESFAIYFGIRNILAGMTQDAELGVSAMLANDYALVSYYYDSIASKNIFVKENTANLLLSEIKSLQETQEDIIRVRGLIQLTASALIIMLVLISIFYAVRFSDKLTRPIEHLSIIAKNIVSGKIDIEGLSVN